MDTVIPNVEILADSRSIETGHRLTTYLLHRFPKCLLAELNTHRLLSRNAASSRAIPIEKMIERVQADPYLPTWTLNKRGMQGTTADRLTSEEAELVALRLMDTAINEVQKLIRLGVHKQNANRYLEPWMRVPVLVSGTEWENFFRLRCDAATHPDFRAIALEMQQAMADSTPKDLRPEEWHLVYFAAGERGRSFEDRLKIATARAARISYTTHQGHYDLDADLRLHDTLLAQAHLSPFEHCAVATSTRSPQFCRTRNYKGFYSYRAHLEDGITAHESIAP
jgi:thymidylate synthase ThyX